MLSDPICCHSNRFLLTPVTGWFVSICSCSILPGPGVWEALRRGRGSGPHIGKGLNYIFHLEHSLNFGGDKASTDVFAPGFTTCESMSFRNELNEHVNPLTFWQVSCCIPSAIARKVTRQTRHGRDGTPAPLSSLPLLGVGPMPAGCPSRPREGRAWVHLVLNRAFGRPSFRGEISPVDGSHWLNPAGRLLFGFAGNKLLETATRQLGHRSPFSHHPLPAGVSQPLDLSLGRPYARALVAGQEKFWNQPPAPYVVQAEG